MQTELERACRAASLVGAWSEPHPPAGESSETFDHRVQFYEDDPFLYRVITEFFTAGLQVGEPLAVFATAVHRAGLCEHLRGTGCDVEAFLSSGQLSLLDAGDTLSTFMVDGLPDADRFLHRVGKNLAELRGRSPSGRLRVFGEMVDLLWRDGNSQATVALELLWNQFGQGGSLSLLCSYFMPGFDEAAHHDTFGQLCTVHEHVALTEDSPAAGDVAQRLRQVSHLQQRARALEGEVEHRKRLEQALREALLERSRAEQALRNSQQELTDFFENAVEGLHSVGPDGIIISANRAELAMLGYSKEEYVGRHIAAFHVDAEVIAEILELLRGNGIVKDREARLRCKDGSIKYVLIQANAYFRDGEFIHTRCFTRDVSEQRHLEDELRRQNEDLVRTVRFSEMFVGILGHDLRNPLSAIATAASLLQRRADSEKLAKPAMRILNSAERMGRMIDQLLDFTRIRLGRGLPIEPQPTDVREICKVAIEEFEGVSEARRLTLDGEGDCVGLWDGDRLLQLVSNLLSNALVHGEQTGQVSVHIDGTPNDFVTLEVRNSGVVRADVLPVLFEPFRSAANEKQERSNGLGLGLFISHQIVLGHRGTISVSSAAREGTRLVVTLPRDARATQAERVGGGRPQWSKKPS